MRDIFWIELRNILNMNAKKHAHKHTLKWKPMKYQINIMRKKNKRKRKTKMKKKNNENIIIVILSLYKCLIYIHMYYVCSWLIDFGHQQKPKTKQNKTKQICKVNEEQNETWENTYIQTLLYWSIFNWCILCKQSKAKQN